MSTIGLEIAYARCAPGCRLKGEPASHLQSPVALMCRGGAPCGRTHRHGAVTCTTRKPSEHDSHGR